ncbi:MAG: hypothetical protein ACFB15_18080 [Cyclobacteriaceae bacterium]
MDKELLFKQAVSTKLGEYLAEFGYKQAHVYKGLIQFQCPNNNLIFIYEWNQTQTFYCSLGFDGELQDYPVDLVIRRIKNENKQKGFKISRDFEQRVNDWAATLRRQFSEIKIENISKQAEVIRQLREELSEQTRSYNRELELNQIKFRIDQAWHKRDYKSIVKILKNQQYELPASYIKKFEIAKKKMYVKS